MKRKKRISGVLLTLAALIIMQLPVSEADAASSASDFKMEGSKLTGYRGTDKNVSIPDTVEVIGRGAFEDDKNIELVVAPNSVRSIEPYAFWGCDNLDMVVLGTGLTEVGDYAFTNCTGLRQISIPPNVTSIGIEAFKDCANLKDITIPPETVSIHETAFDGCVQLTIHYEEGSAAAEYAEAFYERQKEMPGYQEPTDSIFSDLVREVIANRDREPSPEETVPEEPPVEEVAGELLGSTQVVGNRAVVFMDNADLQVFGEETGEPAGTPGEQIDGSQGSAAGDSGEDSAQGVAGGSSGSAIPKYRVVDGQTVADQAYYKSSSLTEMALPEGIREIGQFSFARSALASLTLPQGLERIDYGAFYHCGQLAEVELPDSVMCVEPKAFDHTLWVDSFLDGGSAGEGSGSAQGDFLVSGGVLAAYRGSQAQVTVPDGVRVIAGEVFKGHEEIESVSLPDSVLVVGEGAFEGCTRLEGLSLGGNVKEIKDRAFLGNAMDEIPVPSSVEKVGLQAFGTAVAVYEGREPEQTYETSAARLSNEAYRIYREAEDGQPDVSVEGLEGASASLEEASRSYVLTLEDPEDISGMERAFQRSFQSGIPEQMVLYDMALTDGSGIPLTVLGNRKLTVTLPVPEALRGQELRLVALDRNGQLQSLAAVAEGTDSISFTTNLVSMIGLMPVQ